ncbi:MAG TPA: trypsin-like serine protease [Polyangia bacterium]
MGTESRLSEIINGTPVGTDPAGYAYLTNSQVVASGMFLAPNWIITAGHFLADNDGASRSSWGTPPQVSAYIGTTTTGFNGTPYVHPRWWGALHVPPPLGLRDWAYDVGLVRLNSVWANTAGYANNLFNQLSNNWVGATVSCYGYGQTNLNGSGGGLQMLQNADFDTVSYEINPGQGIPDPVGPSSVEMITVADSPSGQRLFHGDSGGTCANVGGSPYVISGIAESFKDHPDGTHTTYLVDPWNIKYWVDATMHGPYPGPPSAPPVNAMGFTSAATKTGFTGTFIGNHRNYIVATPTDLNALPYIAINSASGWAAWSRLAQLPNLMGSNPSHSLIGLTSIQTSTGEPNILMAVSASNDASSKMFVSQVLTPGTTGPRAMSWNQAGPAPAGNQFKGAPSVVMFGPGHLDRLDFYSYASNANDDNGAIYYRWAFNGPWQNAGWDQIPQPPNGVTINSSPSAALQGTTLYLAARGSDGAMWINTLPNATDSGTYGGPWTGWASLGGVWISPPALTAWDRGVDLYGLGMDNTVYHVTMDADGWWSDYIQISTTQYPTLQITAQNLLPSTHEIDILTVSGQTPILTRFPW